MSDISTYLQEILDAVYGEQVRTSIYNSILQMNTDLEEAIENNLNSLSFKGDLTDPSIGLLFNEENRGIYRLSVSVNYTGLPDDYDVMKAGYLIVYSLGSNTKQELHYFSSEDHNASACWSRNYGGPDVGWSSWDRIGEDFLGFRGNLANGVNLDTLVGESSRGIYRILSSRNYSNLPSDYDDTKAGYIIIYSFGNNNVKQELHYFSGSSKLINTYWSRNYMMTGDIGDDTGTGVWSGWTKSSFDVEDGSLVQKKLKRDDFRYPSFLPHDSYQLANQKRKTDIDSLTTSYKHVQGACFIPDPIYTNLEKEGTYILCFWTGETGFLVETTTTFEAKRRSGVFYVGHGNDIAYNPNTRKLYIATSDAKDAKTPKPAATFVEVDYDTLTYTRTISLDSSVCNVNCIAYSEENDMYYG